VRVTLPLQRLLAAPPLVRLGGWVAGLVTTTRLTLKPLGYMIFLPLSSGLTYLIASRRRSQDAPPSRHTRA
jgi:hypothetical protein